jgi:hypothetical protein
VNCKQRCATRNLTIEQSLGNLARLSARAFFWNKFFLNTIKHGSCWSAREGNSQAGKYASKDGAERDLDERSFYEM